MRHGFSLVELSIVLVIIGLLTSGILVGQNLIRAAELRSVTRDIDRFQTAFFTFEDKYQALPGDMTNATAFWGAASSCPTGAGTGTQTCNGNGNGIWDASVGVYYEGLRAWQQLANAGLIEGSYSGVQPAATPFMVPGQNVPTARIARGAFTLGFVTELAYGRWSTVPDGNVLFVGTISGDAARSPLFRPSEAWNIDQKFDDGKPAYGKIVSDQVASGSCNTSTTPSTAEYKLVDETVLCALRRQF